MSEQSKERTVLTEDDRDDFVALMTMRGTVYAGPLYEMVAMIERKVLERAANHSEDARAMAASQSAEPVALTATLERDLERVMEERDAYHEMADKLSNGIAEHFDIDIGEHSNLNCPWQNALDAMETAICAQGIAATGAQGLTQAYNLISHAIAYLDEGEPGNAKRGLADALAILAQAAPIRGLDLYDEIECDLPALFGRASLEGHEAGQRLAEQVQDKMRRAREQLEASAQAAPSASAQQAESMGVMDVVRLHNEIQRDLSAPAPSASPGALTDEREAFEAAWRAVYPQHGAGAFKHSEMSWGGYANTRVNDGWKMWQARAILAASPAPAQGAQEDARDAARDLTNFAFHNQVDINAAMSREQSQGGRDD